MKADAANHVWYFPYFISVVVFLFTFSLARGLDLNLGQKNFEGKCARCHGKDGTGNPKMAKRLKVSLEKINLHRDEVVNMSVYQIESMIDSGKHRMPTYRGKLTDEQIHDIAQYVKILIGNETEKEK